MDKGHITSGATDCSALLQSQELYYMRQCAMIRDELERTIQSGKWFSRLGSFSACGNFVAITDLGAWVTEADWNG
jgi:hypothetical protein